MLQEQYKFNFFTDRLMILRNLISLGVALFVSNQVVANDNLSIEIQELKKKITALEEQTKQNNAPELDPQVVQKLNLEFSKGANSVELKPYGFLRLDAAYHIKGSDKMFNRINNVPLDGTLQQSHDRLLFTPTVSRLGLDISKEHNGKEVQAKIEVDFRGGSSQDQLRIRHAYVKLDQWLIGQTTSPFVSTDILPEMLDFQANLGGAMLRNNQIQYQHQIHPHLKTWIALEDGSKGTDDQTRLPAVSAKIQYKGPDNKSVLNARGLLIQKKTSQDDALAWGVGVGGIYHVDERNKIHADYYHVKGDSKYVLYANEGYAIDDQQNIVENEFDSIALGLTHQWSSKWRSTLGFGGMWAQQGDYANLLPSMNKKVLQGWINLYYSPYKLLNYGVEYIYGERTDFNGNEGTDNRIGAMVRYAF